MTADADPPPGERPPGEPRPERDEALDRLDGLRHRMRRLDAAVLALIAERMALAREVGEAKRRAGIPLRDFAVEKHVLDRAAVQAGEVGLAPELARTVMQQLIAEACRVQEEAHYSGYSGDAESILIVGGQGRMGRWFARFFTDQGHRVRLFDERRGDGDYPAVASLEEGLGEASLALVAVSLDRSSEAIDQVVASGWRGTLFDIASLKGHLRPAFDRARAAGLAVTSVHPMFGPTARILSDRVICLCDCGDAGATTRIAGLFGETAARLVYLSLEEHDRIASYVLGLSHFVNLIFARVLADSGLSLDELAAVGSTTFQSQLDTTASVVREDPELYFGIQRLNRFTPEVYQRLRRALEDGTAAVLGGRLDQFAAGMLGSRAWLDGGEVPPVAPRG